MIPDSDLRIDRIRGTGPGGQHRNKTASCVRVTHLPSGLSVTIDGRYQHKNLVLAMKELENRILQAKQQKRAAAKKARRDEKIHDHTTVRTYNYSRGLVKDHRTGKVASIKDVVDKGRLDLLL